MIFACKVQSAFFLSCPYCHVSPFELFSLRHNAMASGWKNKKTSYLCTHGACWGLGYILNGVAVFDSSSCNNIIGLRALLVLDAQMHSLCWIVPYLETGG